MSAVGVTNQPLKVACTHLCVQLFLWWYRSGWQHHVTVANKL
jgi:hypothetical protein